MPRRRRTKRSHGGIDSASPFAYIPRRMWPFPGKKLGHKAFGPLRPYRAGQFWRGRVDFKPLNTRIWLSIHAGSAGPTDGQEKLYLTLVKKYETILPKLLGALHHEYERVRKLPPDDPHWPRKSARELPGVIPLHSIWLEEGAGHP